jgi:hypothetical protein
MAFVEHPAEPCSPEWLAKRVEGIPGTEAAAVLGLSAYENAEDCYRRKQVERRMSPHQLYLRSKEMDGNVHIEAGRKNESILGGWAWRNCWDPETTTLYHPRLCFSPPPMDWCQSTPDFTVCGSDGKAIALIECKFSLNGVPLKPMLEHLIQCQQQLGITHLPHTALIYGTRRVRAEDGTDNPIPWDQPLGGNLCVRVFRVEHSEALWQWMLTRERRFHDARVSNQPTPPETPQIRTFVQHVWFDSPTCATPNYSCMDCVNHFFKRHPRFLQEPDYLPPAPKWRVVVPLRQDGPAYLMCK